MYDTKKQPKTPKLNIKPTPRKIQTSLCTETYNQFLKKEKNNLVLLESPYAGKTKKEIDHNVKYAQLCMKDCFDRGEYPFASHLLYTQPGILNDTIPEEREKGIMAGLAWGRHASKTVVYCDYGISKCMMEGMEKADSEGREVEKRYLYYSSGRIINK